MTEYVILNYIKCSLNIKDSCIDEEFLYLLENALDNGIDSNKILSYSFNLYKELLASNNAHSYKRVRK